MRQDDQNFHPHLSPHNKLKHRVKFLTMSTRIDQNAEGKFNITNELFQ